MHVGVFCCNVAAAMINASHLAEVLVRLHIAALLPEHATGLPLISTDVGSCAAGAVLLHELPMPMRLTGWSER